MVFANSEGSDQPARTRRLIWVFTVALRILHGVKLCHKDCEEFFRLGVVHDFLRVCCLKTVLLLISCNSTQKLWNIPFDSINKDIIMNGKEYQRVPKWISQSLLKCFSTHLIKTIRCSLIWKNVRAVKRLYCQILRFNFHCMHFKTSLQSGPLVHSKIKFWKSKKTFSI